MNFTREQNYEILEKLINQKNGLEEILQMSLEILMKAEREEHNIKNSDLSNGYRYRKTYGHGRVLELKIPRTRNGNFYPVILGLLRDQEEEAQRLAFKLYGAGLTTDQVGDIFKEVYGRNYSTSQVSRMFDYAREEVQNWQNRPLDNNYPIIFIDATYVPTRRVDSVSKEAYYTILALKSDMTREVLGVFNNPTESASFWHDIFENLKKRGVKEVGLVVSDGLNGIETTIHKHFPMADVQLCAVHLQREILKYVKPKHKQEISMDMKEVFTTDKSFDTPEQGLQRWKDFCRKWGVLYPNIAKKAENQRYIYYFTYLKYHTKIRSMIYSTNWIERLNRDYKRTTKMRGALPNPDAALLLLCNVAMTRKYYDYKIVAFKAETKFKWVE